MTEVSGKQTTWKGAIGALLLFMALLASLAAFFWFLIHEISQLDSNVAAAIIGAAATVSVSAFAVFAGRYLERRKELEAAARDRRIPLSMRNSSSFGSDSCMQRGSARSRLPEKS